MVWNWRSTAPLRLREVFEVAGVADALGVEAQPPVTGQRGRVGHAQPVAVAVGHCVVGQEIGVEHAAAARRQVAVFGARRQAAPRIERGLECQVAVRRQVEVVGHRQLQATAARIAQLREQETALARRPGRKRDVGQVEDGNALELHARIARHAHLLVAIDAHLAGADVPVRRVGRAGGVEHLLRPRPACRSSWNCACSMRAVPVS
jgi:hypothetical protein